VPHQCHSVQAVSPSTAQCRISTLLLGRLLKMAL
jgi:hypothetical protein